MSWKYYATVFTIALLLSLHSSWEEFVFKLVVLGVIIYFLWPKKQRE